MVRAVRKNGETSDKWEYYVKCDLKVLKMYNWKKQA
jgi:hypothetical protein